MVRPLELVSSGTEKRNREKIPTQQVQANIDELLPMPTEEKSVFEFLNAKLFIHGLFKTYSAIDHALVSKGK